MNDEIFKLILKEDINGLKSYLNKNSVDLSQKNDMGNSLLHEACEEGNIEIMKLLLDQPIDINIAGNDNLTPLHLAVINEDSKILEMLLQKGADINCKSIDGNTPLWMATMYNNVKNSKKDIIQILLKAGADPSIKNKHGISLYNFLSMPKNIGIKDLFPPEIK